MSLPVQMPLHAHAHAHGAKNGLLQSPAPPIATSAPVRDPTPSNILSETTAATWLAIGSLAESLGDLEKALSSYDSALRHAPNSPDALIKLANIYRSKDVFFKAAELYEQALNYSPENGETWGLLGHCYLMLDDLQRAYAAYQRALYYLDNPNVPKLWHGIGILYDRYGSLEYAEEAFVRVLELDPNFDKSNEIYFRLGIIYKHQGKLQNALECFQYILANPPHPLTQPDVWFQIGSVLEQQKDWNGAKDAYERVLAVNPQHAKVLQQLGCLYSQADAGEDAAFQQDLTVALKYLTQSLEIDQADAHSWYYLGRVHMIRGDFNAAYEAFQQAVNRDSRNPTFWCSIGVLYYQISQYRDALDAYTRAIRLNPYISEVWYDLGTLYETCNNQISDALDAYRQAERLDPGNPHIKARLDQLIQYQQEGNTHPPQPPPVSQQPRLPQSVVLESTQPPQESGYQPLGGLQAPPQLLNSQYQSSLPPPVQSIAPVKPPTLANPPVPQLKTPKHDLDDKKDKIKPKKKKTSNSSTPVVAKSQIKTGDSLSTLMNAAAAASKDESAEPEKTEPEKTEPENVEAVKSESVEAEAAVPAPAPVPVVAPAVAPAPVPAIAAIAPAAAPAIAPATAPAPAPAPAPAAVPDTQATQQPTPTPSANPDDKSKEDDKEEEDEEEDEHDEEPVEPPMRKIDEDENYDDE
ncbi:glucose repression mediator protein [Yamadazyma tenuis]|uniref:glucose repression mediator protein n=1 Tax=Candida tenuis TaxID=2315449 RepID=UPI0027A6DF14|nr:glucose repression mediator protein [Yamadazyma tenuis]